MTTELLRRVAFVHGIVAWLGALSLVLVSFMHFRGKPTFARLRIASLLATLFAASAFASGALLDLGYRVHLRQRLFLASRALGWLFERKLHFSFGALALSCLALAALFAAGDPAEDPITIRLRSAARAGYVASAVFALVACVASSLVAARVRF
jgi:hypothetical protein